MNDKKKGLKKAKQPTVTVAQRGQELEALIENEGSYQDLKVFIAREEALGKKGNRTLKIVSTILRMYAIIGLYEYESELELSYDKEITDTVLQYQKLRGNTVQKDLLADSKIQAWQKKLAVRDFGSIINLFFETYVVEMIQASVDVFCDQFLDRYRAKAPDCRSPEHAHWVISQRDHFSFLADEFYRIDEWVASLLVPGSEYDVKDFYIDDSVNTFFCEVYRDLEQAILSEELLYSFTRNSISHIMPKTNFYTSFMAWAISWHSSVYFIKELLAKNKASAPDKQAGQDLPKTFPFLDLKRMVVRLVPERAKRIKELRSSVIDYHDVLHQLEAEFHFCFPEVNFFTDAAK